MKLPIQQRILNSVLSLSTVPYSSYVAEPVTLLHRVHPIVKQLWLLALYIIIARAPPHLRIGIAVFTAAISFVVLPRRLCMSQLANLAVLCAVIYVFTAIGSDGVPPVLQSRAPPVALENLPPLQSDSGYNYVVCNLWIITITKKSLNLALSASTLTFTTLQTASLCLVTTTSEQLSRGLEILLTPLRYVGLPVKHIVVTLLLSLRFVSLVFEEFRNLCMGLAARGVDWEVQGGRGSIAILGKFLVRMFGNLFERSENIAQAMVVRGFAGPQLHTVYYPDMRQYSIAASATALLTLFLLVGYVLLLQ